MRFFPSVLAASKLAEFLSATETNQSLVTRTELFRHWTVCESPSAERRRSERAEKSGRSVGGGSAWFSPASAE
jgi:hypothetical protein